jgi:membrane associated rhomboid family serine protease
MIYDRDYMREPESKAVRASVALLWVLGACFIIQSILAVYARIDPVDSLGLNRQGMASGQVWRVFTYQFLHSVPWPFHVLSNCLGLYFFGRSVEERIGTRRFLWVYFGGGVVGGLVQLGLDWAFQRPPSLAMVGASAGVSALIAAFCRFFAEREAQTLIYFFPVTIKAKTFLWIITAFTVWGALFPSGNVAHGAHLGGLAVGFFAAGALDPEGWWAEWQSRRSAAKVVRFPKARAARTSASTTPLSEAPSSTPRRSAETSAEFVSREVDPILDKIAAHGMQSLTDEERRILESARRRIERR